MRPEKYAICGWQYIYCSVTACFGLTDRVQENYLWHCWKEMKALQFVGALASSRKASIAFVMSTCPSVSVYVCLHTSARLPLDGFRWNLILGPCLKICHEIPFFFKIRLKFTYTLTCWCKYLSLLLTALDRHKSTRFEWNGIRLLG